MGPRTILTMMKDEAPFLLHWIAHHRLIGFDQVVVLTNDCSDGTDAMLDRLQAMGEVLHHPNPVKPGDKPQPMALRRAGKLDAITQSDWLIAMDVDEYLLVKTGHGTLTDLFETAPDATGFALTWRMMGSNGLQAWTDMPVPEAYTRGAPDLFRKGWGVKTLFRPFDGMKLGIHRPTVRGKDKSALRAMHWVNGSAKPMTNGFKDGMWRSSLATLGYAHAEIAHFATQSQDAFLKRILRGNVNAKPDKYDAPYFGMFDRNETEQTGLLVHAEATAARVRDYLADPVLADLHGRAAAWHADALNRIRTAPDYQDRIAALQRAAAIPFDRLDDVLFPQPLAPEGKAVVAKMKAHGLPDLQIARQVAASVSRLDARRDAADAAELLAMGVVPDHGDWG